MPIKIFIEVSGGSIKSIVTNSKDAQVYVLDYDNAQDPNALEEEKAPSIWKPESVMTDEGFQEYMDKTKVE